MNEFYVILPSNSIRKDNLKNELWNFRNYLPDPLLLYEKWEVALTEITFPNTWSNTLFEDDYIAYRHFTNENNPLLKKKIKRNAENGKKIEYYEARTYLRNFVVQNEIDFTDILRTNRPYWWRGSILFKFQTQEINLGRNMGLKFSPNLSKLFGFPQNIWRNKNERISSFRYKSNYPFDFGINLYHMYIYSNIVKYTFVGNSFVPLLRCIPIQYTKHPKTNIKFDLPFYFEVDKKLIEYIDIEIASSLGDKIKFKSGEILLTLHFRKKRKYGTL